MRIHDPSGCIVIELASLISGERNSVTVCVAVLFRWNYASVGEPVRFGYAGVFASDRMITAGDVKYEPNQMKIAEMTPQCVVLVAGDYSVHSQAVRDTQKTVRNSRDKSPENIARLYGKAIQSIKQRQAEDLYLTPLGMNSDTFIAQQKDMADSFIERITHQLQSYEGESVEAIVIGSDAENVHLYTVDSRGIAHCLDDVGFAAIGIGAWHAKSRLMQMGYTNQLTLAPALAAAFAAKRAGDLAPGVGEFTDMHIIVKDFYFPVWKHTNDKIHELYKEVAAKIAVLAVDTIKELDTFITTPRDQDGKAKEAIGVNTQTNASANPPTAEAAPKDETEQTKTVDYT
jgi:20S proteasome alpha/beta subunit